MVAPETRRLLEAVGRGGAACSAAEVRDLLRDGADANAADRTGRPALLLAVGSRCGPAVAEALLEGGADPNAADRDGRTALLLAASRETRCLATLRALLRRGADCAAEDADGRTPLHAAAVGPSWGGVEALLEGGADPNAADGKRRATPLLVAARRASVGDVRRLLDAGADPNAADRCLVTPLHAAVHVRRVSSDAGVVALLLERGAAVDAATSEGATALHLAVQRARPREVELLLAHGADPNATNNKGETPLELVRRRDHAMGVSLNSAAAGIIDMLLGSGRLRVDGLRDAHRLLGIAAHRGPDALKLFGGAGLVVRSTTQLADATRAAGLSSRPAAAVRVLLGMVPAARRAAYTHKVWLAGLRSPEMRAVLFTPGVLAAFLAECARCAEEPGVLRLAVRDGAAKPGYTAAAVAQLLRAGARGVDDALLALLALAQAHGRGARLVSTLRVLLAHGADPERVCNADGAAKSAMWRLIDAHLDGGGKFLDAVRDAVAPRAEAVRASMLRATGDRDATRLVLAFFSSLAPLSVPLGELATNDQLQAARRAQRAVRPVVRARRRRRQPS